MSTVTQTVTLKSDRHFGKKVPPHAFGDVLRLIPTAVKQSIRMAIEGRSKAKGKSPGWLSAATDIRFVDHGGKDDTILYFEAPRLGDAAHSLYQQKELWPSKPDPADSGFDVLGDVLSDIAANNPDSDRFDRPLLSQLGRFRPAFGRAFQEMAITGRRFPDQKPAIMNQEIITTARMLCTNTPQTKRVRVVGKLDMIRASTSAFALQLDDGQEVSGVLVSEAGVLGHLYNRRVMILGRAVFRPSGRLLRIDAEEMSDAPDEGSFFSTVPTPTRKKLDVRQIVQEQQSKKGLSAIFGKWPGDETDEEIQQALRELS
jgi:hypothetical protein